MIIPSTILNANNETDDNVILNLKDIYPSKNKISAQNLKMLWEKNVSVCKILT